MASRGYRQKCIDAKGEECDICGSSKTIQVHHLDRDRRNDDLENLVPLCREHHNEIHKSPDEFGEYFREPEPRKDHPRSMRRVKFDCLVIAAVEDGPHGREIRELLADEPYNHDRLSMTSVYSILDESVGDEYIEKSKRDGRTNRYDLADDGREYLREWRDLLDEALQ